MSFEKGEDTVRLLYASSAEEEGEDEPSAILKEKDVPQQSSIAGPARKNSNAPVLPVPAAPARKRAADFPYSTEEDDFTSGSGVETIQVRIPNSSPHHHVTRPQENKTHRRARIVCGALVSLALCGLVAAAIALVLTATGPKGAWYRKGVVYQCYPQSFQDSNGDGIGDLEGIRSRVSYFRELGVSAVWLNPIFESPQRDNGYDVSNYTAINPIYGNIETFKALVNELHADGIHLLLDFVPNHTSDRHPWFIESRSDRTNPKRHWYVWADGLGEDTPPNNWLSVFGNSSWTYDDTTDQWYLHQFSVFQPDLNYTNPEVRAAMANVLRYWLDLGVDGFRVDAVKFLLEDPELRNETYNFLFNSSSCFDDSDQCQYDSLVHNMTTNYPGIHQICREWQSIVEEYSTRDGSEKILIGEIYDPINTVMTYYGNSSNKEFTFPFNFFLLQNSNWTGTGVNCIVKQWLDAMPLDATPNWVLGNHDNSRIASKAGVFRAQALNVLLLTLPGTPITYYGEEILMTDVDVPPDERKDVYAGRDPERTPMQWNASENSGFTYPGVKPWLPLATNFTTVNVMAETNNATSMLSLYKRILNDLHSSRPAFYEGSYTCLNATEELLVYLRHCEGEEDYKEHFVIAINFSNEEISTGLNLKLTNVELVLSSYLDQREFGLSSFRLRSGEAVIIRGYSSEKSCNRVEFLSSQSCGEC